MNQQEVIANMSYCGLICSLCQPQSKCSCRANNHCGQRLSDEGCYQYACCREKGLSGCWECPEGPCDQGMHHPDKKKIRAFITCIKEDGMEKFTEYLLRNEDSGILYHRDGILGDYDLPTEEAVLSLLRSGERPQ